MKMQIESNILKCDGTYKQIMEQKEKNEVAMIDIDIYCSNSCR